MSVCIWGVGTSRFARQPERLPAELAWEAVAEALADAGVDEVDAAYVDLDGGPRLLLRLHVGTARAAIGDRVRLTAPTAEGNAAGELAT